MDLLPSSKSALQFDVHPQVYNWYYPQPNPSNEMARDIDPYALVAKTTAGRSALYIHIPFCDTICTFCPFVRAGYRTNDEIAIYVGALIREIEAKAAYSSIASRRFSAIFVGGGTPSVLSPAQIRRIGQALHKNFDLRKVEEFTVEFEAKSVTAERVAAFREIGANRGSMGVQTFSPKFRDIFNLTASLEEINNATDMLKAAFPYINIDILYGMNGQSFDEFIVDLQAAAALETTTIDLYPVNNLATQLRLHREFGRRAMLPLSGNTKFAMRQFGADYLIAAGFKPHNGYSFTRVAVDERKNGKLFTRRLGFLYHDIVYGYENDEFIGLGAGAISQTRHYKVGNIENRNAYVKAALGDSRVDASAYALDRCAERGIVYFPYRGELDANVIDWNAVPAHTRVALDRACEAGLVKKTSGGFTVTKEGWLSYVHLMHFFTPPDQLALLTRRLGAYAEEGRTDGDYFAVSSAIRT